MVTEIIRDLRFLEGPNPPETGGVGDASNVAWIGRRAIIKYTKLTCTTQSEDRVGFYYAALRRRM